jgi:hypothetical protein
MTTQVLQGDAAIDLTSRVLTCRLIQSSLCEPVAGGIRDLKTGSGDDGEDEAPQSQTKTVPSGAPRAYPSMPPSSESRPSDIAMPATSQTSRFTYAGVLRGATPSCRDYQATYGAGHGSGGSVPAQPGDHPAVRHRDMTVGEPGRPELRRDRPSPVQDFQPGEIRRVDPVPRPSEPGASAFNASSGSPRTSTRSVSSIADPMTPGAVTASAASSTDRKRTSRDPQLRR